MAITLGGRDYRVAKFGLTEPSRVLGTDQSVEADQALGAPLRNIVAAMLAISRELIEPCGSNHVWVQFNMPKNIITMARLRGRFFARSGRI
jgi:hypothetical protein